MSRKAGVRVANFKVVESNASETRQWMSGKDNYKRSNWSPTTHTDSEGQCGAVAARRLYLRAGRGWGQGLL